MVIIAMNPKLQISTDDIGRVWAVLNPAGAEWIPFSTFVRGMIQVKRDPVGGRNARNAPPPRPPSSAPPSALRPAAASSSLLGCACL